MAGAGPVTIIICSNAAQAKRVIKKCQNFLKGDNLNEKFTCQAADGQSEDKDIQVTLKQRSFEIKSLFFFVQKGTSSKWYRCIGDNCSMPSNTYEKSIFI